MDHPALRPAVPAFRALWVLPLLGAAACGSATSPERTPARVTLDGFDTPVPVGGTERLTARVESAAGGTLSGPDVRWTSRDTTTAVVDGQGLVTGVNTGEAWIVARSGGVADSVVADVRFSPLRPGEVHVRLRGDEELTLGVHDGYSVFIDRLGGDAGDFQVIRIEGISDAGYVRMTLGIYGPGRLPEGTTSFGETPVELLGAVADTLRAPLAFLALDHPLEVNTVQVVMLDPPAHVDISYLSTPPGPGGVKGELVGRVVARGVGYDGITAPGTRPRFTPNGNTYDVVADFDLPYGHAAEGTSRGEATVDGVRLAWDHAQTRYVALGGGHSGLEIDPLDGDLVVQVIWPSTLEGPTGTWTLRDTAQVDTAAAGIALYRGQPPADAPSAAGTVRVERFDPGTGLVSGEVEGSVDAVFYEPGGRDTITATYDFLAPVGTSQPSFAPPAPGGAGSTAPTLARLLGPILTGSGPAASARPPRRTMPGAPGPRP